MSKIIIHNDASFLSDYSALCYVNDVISKGKISGSKGKKQYCYATVFHPNKDYSYVVTCKKGGDTYTFKVYREVRKLEEELAIN